MPENYRSYLLLLFFISPLLFAEPATATEPETMIAPERETPTTGAVTGCHYDTQCKGNRICEHGMCMYPDASRIGAIHNTPSPQAGQMILHRGRVATPARTLAMTFMIASIPGALWTGAAEGAYFIGARYGLIAAGGSLLALGYPIMKLGIKRTQEDYPPYEALEPARRDRAARYLYMAGLSSLGAALALNTAYRIRDGADDWWWDEYNMRPLYGTAALGSVLLLTANSLTAKSAFVAHRRARQHALYGRSVSWSPMLASTRQGSSFGMQVAW